MSADAIKRIHETKFARTALQSVTEAGRFSGYASLFGEVDLGRDAVAAGAFSKSLANQKTSAIRMLFQHNPDEPIGHWVSLVEDAVGLRVEGQLALDVAKAREVHALLKTGALDGLSIGFKTVRAKTDAVSGIRTIVEAELWEISVVTFPMLPTARVEAVKSARLPTIREFERFLVRDAGLTRSEAKRTVAQGYASVVGTRDARGQNEKTGEAELARKMRDFARHLQSM
ncbi:MAG: HK97 family phage prohead protease [Ahrensia sp.]